LWSREGPSRDESLYLNNKLKANEGVAQGPEFNPQYLKKNLTTKQNPWGIILETEYIQAIFHLSLFSQ
jgi:hypothetical protein